MLAQDAISLVQVLAVVNRVVVVWCTGLLRVWHAQCPASESGAAEILVSLSHVHYRLSRALADSQLPRLGRHDIAVLPEEHVHRRIVRMGQVVVQPGDVRGVGVEQEDYAVGVASGTDIQYHPDEAEKVHGARVHSVPLAPFHALKFRLHFRTTPEFLLALGFPIAILRFREFD